MGSEPVRFEAMLCILGRGERNHMDSGWQRATRWLHPGLRVKRWFLLILIGIAVAAMGAVLVLNLFAYELTVYSGGPLAATAIGSIAILIGLALVALAMRQVVRSVATALLPDEDQLVDVMLTRRRRAMGPAVVTIGGGTGLSQLLRGLKTRTSNLTAIATISDDGGSSGRLTRDLPGLGLPPGDIRNCLVALADEEPLMTQLLQYRFNGASTELGGHSLGNLLIAALTDITGDFERAVQETSRVLAIRGRVLPPTLQKVELCARTTRGTELRGETTISTTAESIDYIFLDPTAPPAVPEVLEAIAEARVIIIGPGSTYTSVTPNLLVAGVADALANTPALRIFVCNVMTQPGETDSFKASDHVAAIEKHVDSPVFEYVIVNTQRPDREILQRYHAAGATFVEPDVATIARMGYIPVEGEFLSDDDWARHNPDRLSDAIIRLVAQETKIGL
jgi:uncharacterized cofD-like protein